MGQALLAKASLEFVRNALVISNDLSSRIAGGVIVFGSLVIQREPSLCYLWGLSSEELHRKCRLGRRRRNSCTVSSPLQRTSPFVDGNCVIVRDSIACARKQTNLSQARFEGVGGAAAAAAEDITKIGCGIRRDLRQNFVRTRRRPG